MPSKNIQLKILKRKAKFVLNPLKRYTTDNHFQARAKYTHYIEKNTIDNTTVLYEAYHGQSMTGNPYAVFKELISHPTYKSYKHIWVVKKDVPIPAEYKGMSNVLFVQPNSSEYIKYLATAKYLINDTTFPYYFQKRPEQIYANIWHGTPLKHMGLDIKNRGMTDHKNIQRNFLHTDYMVSPNKFTYETMLRSHDVDTIFSGQVLDTGFPRIDLMFHADKEKIRQSLSVPKDKKVILYAPTWRGKLSNKDDMSQQLLDEVEKIKSSVSDEYTVLLKSHYYAYDFFKENGMEHLCVPNSMDTNEVLAITDILITDYSSIFFDYLPSKKPVIYYAYDAEDYEETRGLYISMDDLPGPLCKHIDKVIDSINNIENIQAKYKERYNEFVDKFCYHDDGNATKRFVDTVFDGKPSEDCFKVETNKTKILIYCGGFFNNGITTSVINLLNSIDYDKYDVTAIDYGDNSKPEKQMNLAKLNSNVKVIYRVGTWNATLSEWYRHQLFLNRGAYTEKIKKWLPTSMYQRELKRLIGNTKFDIGIDFSGYSPFWASLIAFGDFKKTSIYLHNNMIEELNKRVNNKYPHRRNLKVVFSLYNYFDKVISVSKLSMLTNMESLSTIIENPSDKMDFVLNCINYNYALEMKNKAETITLQGYTYLLGTNEQSPSNVEIKGFEMPAKENINFINIGRMGPEKDQEKLILAFSEVAKQRDNVRLYIVGEGILRNKLTQLVKSLKLEQKVIFTGQISNPYPLLNACDCFVLSSNHEGQPMVLLESLILNKPIIVTDIPGSRSVVEGGYGLIVDNSVEGVQEGLDRFINGEKMSEKEFDYVQYSKDTVQMFYDKVCL